MATVKSFKGKTSRQSNAQPEAAAPATRATRVGNGRKTRGSAATASDTSGKGRNARRAGEGEASTRKSGVTGAELARADAERATAAAENATPGGPGDVVVGRDLTASPLAPR